MAMTTQSDADVLFNYLNERGWIVAAVGNDPIFRQLISNIPFASLQSIIVSVKEIGRADAVVPLYSYWLDINKGRQPQMYAGWFNLGVELSSGGDGDNAILAYKNALVLQADCFQAAVNLGLQYEAKGDVTTAMEIWARSLQSDEARTTLLNHQGRVLENLKRYEEAERMLYASLLTNPRQPDVIHHWVYLRQKMCCWPVYGPGVPGLTARDIDHDMGPLSLLALIDDQEVQNRYVEEWLARKALPSQPRLSPEEGYAHERLRIGYMSSDYCAHPVSFLMAELFERHDRSKFEVYGYCASPESSP